VILRWGILRAGGSLVVGSLRVPLVPLRDYQSPTNPYTNANTNIRTNPNIFNNLRLPTSIPIDYQLKPETTTNPTTKRGCFGMLDYQSMKSEHKPLILVDFLLISEGS